MRPFFTDDYEGIDRWSRPVEEISWDDAKEFCLRLSQKTEKEYRLPTEAEWEYACRAGTTTAFNFGETISSKLANYDGEESEEVYRKQTTPVGYFGVANKFGLYDLHGNVGEWCEDSWHENYKGAPTDGSAWLSEETTCKIIRGGSWFEIPYSCRSAFRGSIEDHNLRPRRIGFRVVCVAPRTT